VPVFELRSIFRGETIMMDATVNGQQTLPDEAKVSRLTPPRADASDLPEREAVLRAQRGDASAFERLYLLHSARVYSLCLRMVGNPAEAEDLTQEAFMLVMRKIRTFRGDSAFSTWLHRIVVNIVLMRLRRKTPFESSLEEINDQPGARRSPLQELARPDLRLAGSLDRLHLERALAKLRPFQKLVVILHDIQGYKHIEIAKMLHWSIGNSKSQLHRARARLRKLLLENFQFAGIAPGQSSLSALSA
jgi:RNA polymerase sigma-70 factor (ECF subfamily)